MGYPNPAVKAKDYIERYKSVNEALIQVKQILDMVPYNETYWEKVIEIIKQHEY